MASENTNYLNWTELVDIVKALCSYGSRLAAKNGKRRKNRNKNDRGNC